MAACPPSPARAATPCEWAPHAPDQHLVQRGDTLWDLASVFLKNPWCWPQVWESNRDQIRDPHWIYPGQMILLDRTRGVLRLSNTTQDNLQSIRLSPAARSSALEKARIPVIAEQLQRLLARHSLLSPGKLEHAPIVVGLLQNRTLAAEGDTLIVRGELDGQSLFDVIRLSAPVIDPDNEEVLGIAGRKVGQVRLLAQGTLSHRFRVTTSNAELRPGDRLYPAAESVLKPIAIHRSSAPAGKLAAVLHEGRWAGPNDLVAINRGAAHGMEPGSVVRVVQQVRIRADDPSHTVYSPEDAPTVALLLVFFVTERASVGVVMRSSDTITVGDTVLPP